MAESYSTRNRVRPLHCLSIKYASCSVAVRMLIPLIAIIRSPILRVPSRSAGPPDRMLVTIRGRDFAFSSLNPPRIVNP